MLSIDCRAPNQQERTLVLYNDNNSKLLLYKDFKKGKSYQIKYTQRYAHYEDITFFDALTNYEMRGLTIKHLLRGAARLLSYYLKYKNNPTDSIYKDYCRTQVVLLEGLQRTYLRLLVILRDSQGIAYTFGRYSNAYRQCRRYYKHPDLYLVPLQKLLREVQARINKEEFEERINEENADPTYQDELYVQQRPS